MKSATLHNGAPVQAGSDCDISSKKHRVTDEYKIILGVESQADAGSACHLKHPMKSPTTESSFKLIEAVDALLRCDELQREDLSESTHQLIEGVLETAGQVRRECAFPDRREIIEFFAKRFAEENREMLVKRIVALVGTLSDEELYSSYAEAKEADSGRGQGQT